MDRTTRQHEEQDTVNRILSGDTARFTVLVERYQRPVYALIFRIVENAADAEELAQDCFMKAFNALPRFRGTCAFSTWLFRIAYTTAISAVRRPRREVRGVDERRLNSVSEEEADALFAAADERRLEALTAALVLLTAEEQALLHLFYYDAQPIGACAEILRLSEANTKVRLHRIRKKLYLMIVDKDGTRDDE